MKRAFNPIVAAIVLALSFAAPVAARPRRRDRKQP